MHKLTTFFLYAFCVDGLLSMADLLGRRGAPEQVPNFLAVVVSFVVLILGGILFFGMIVTPRLSKRLLLPPIGFLGFCLVWGFLLGDSGLIPLSAAEALLGLGLIIGYWHPQGRGIHDFASHRPRFTVRNLAGTGLLHSFLCVVFAGALALVGAQKLRGILESSTGRYVTIQPGGIVLEERRFQREGKEIRLISMIHIAKSDFYDEVTRALPAGSKAIVLLEGISDREGYLRGNLDYSNAARMLGFTSQQESTFTQKAVKGLAEAKAAEEQKETAEPPSPLEYRRADMDTAEFDPTTVHWITAFGNVLQSSNFREALTKYSMERGTFEQGAQSICADLLDKRNAHLEAEIRKALDAHTLVIVPWGARHMPDVQKEIERWGFVETERVQRQAFRFQNKALVGFLAWVDRLPGDTAP